MTSLQAIAKRYRAFVDEQVRGRSPIYVELGLAVAETPEILSFLAGLPVAKQQPNLLFAAVRHVCGVPGDGSALAAAIREHGDAIRAVMLSHSTQTNEPGRCALLMPADAGDDVPVFPCAIEPASVAPQAYPTVAWRGGLDLNPLDPSDPDQVAWLQTLIWPEQTARADRLTAALAIARDKPAPIQQRSLLDPLDDIFAAAPAGTTRVLFHSSVLVYIEDLEERRAVSDRIRAACDVWICNESPRVLPWIAKKAPTPPHGMFMLSVNGRPVAWTDPHGASLIAIGDRLGIRS